LNPVSFKWNDTSNTDGETGEVTTSYHSRTHLGFVAQEVEAAITNQGESLQTTDIIDNDSFLDPEAEDIYSIRLASLMAPLIKAVQELSTKNAQLEARVATLEG
jgi:hypothetical protein